MAVKKALTKVHVNGTSNERDKTLELALAQIEKAFVEILRISGFPDLKLKGKIDFNKLYSQRLS